MDAAAPSDEGGDVVAAAAAPRRGPCASCGAASRYTCPGCGAASCSAACVGAHKAAAGCAGKRRRAAFVALKAFDDATLRSDLRLLEETALAADRARRARAADAQHAAQGLPRAAMALQKAARERGTELLFQAPGMARREGNTSGIRHKSKTIVWHVEWVFAGTDVRAQGRLAEDLPLSVGLAAQLGAAAPGGAAARHALREFIAATDAARAAPAAAADAAQAEPPPPPPLLLFLEKVGVPAAAAARWLPLRAELPLKEQLAGKWLLEHPTVHVALPAQAAAYPLADGAAPEPPPPGNKWI